MKKILALFTVLLLSLGTTNLVMAQNERASDRAKTAQSEKVVGEKNNDTKPITPVQSLLRSQALLHKVKETVIAEEADEEVVEEVQQVVEEQEEAGTEVEQTLEKVEGRPGLLRFILGPDYRNAGQIRSQIVRLRNQTAQLTRLKERVPEEAQPEIDSAIEELNAETEAIQLRLGTALEGFSLFGWLSRFLSGYSPVDPSPSPLPTVSPVSSASPEASSTPVPTAEE